MCDPRLKSQRVGGRDREAGCDWREGTSKRERVAMPPEATRAMEMLRTCMVGIVAEGMMLEGVYVAVDVTFAGTGEDSYTEMDIPSIRRRRFCGDVNADSGLCPPITGSNSEHARDEEVYVLTLLSPVD